MNKDVLQIKAMERFRTVPQIEHYALVTLDFFAYKQVIIVYYLTCTDE